MANTPTPMTWVAGQIVTAAQMNTQLRDALNYILGTGTNQHPYVHAYQATAQSLSSGVVATVVLDAEAEDSDGSHVNGATTTVITVNTPGLYDVRAQVGFPSNATGKRELKLQKNFTDFGLVQTNQPPTGSMYLNGSCFARCVAGDTLSLTALQSSGAAMSLLTGPSNTFLQTRWVRE